MHSIPTKGSHSLVKPSDASHFLVRPGPQWAQRSSAHERNAQINTLHDI